MTTGEKLRKLRTDNGLTTQCIAETFGCAKSAWYMYERDERVPRDELKIKIADFFKLTVQEIFYDDAAIA